MIKRKEGVIGDKSICDVTHFMMAYLYKLFYMFYSLGSSSSPLSLNPQVCRFGIDQKVSKSKSIVYVIVRCGHEQIMKDIVIECNVK